MFSLVLTLLLVMFWAGVLCDEFVVDAESGMMTVAKSCLHICKQGACLFKDCSFTRCPGGACHFVDSKFPSCSGGACIFERCIGATCDGGSCTFRDPKDTLKAGYCTGGNCNIEGQDHPDMTSYLTI